MPSTWNGQRPLSSEEAEIRKDPALARKAILLRLVTGAAVEDEFAVPRLGAEGSWLLGVFALLVVPLRRALQLVFRSSERPVR
jgi:hypothetical protein